MRDYNGDTLDAVADAVGMSKSHLWALEQDRVPRPSVLSIGKLAKHHGRTIDWFVEGGNSADAETVAFARRYAMAPAKVRARVMRLASIVMEGDEA